MRAFVVAARAIVGFYDEMLPFIAMSLLYWVTGGVFVAAAAVAASILFAGGGPWWLAPLIAIPAGPAILALACVTRETTRGRAADRLDYVRALRANWKIGLALNGLGMVVLSLLLLNLVFYAVQESTVFRLLAIIWAYLLVFWVSIQVYVYPVHQALDRPTLLHSLRMSSLAAFANPFFSLLLLASALFLTAVSVVLPVLLVIAWPALMALLGEHAWRLLLSRAGLDGQS